LVRSTRIMIPTIATGLVTPVTRRTEGRIPRHLAQPGLNHTIRQAERTLATTACGILARKLASILFGFRLSRPCIERPAPSEQVVQLWWKRIYRQKTLYHVVVYYFYTLACEPNGRSQEGGGGRAGLLTGCANSHIAP
jgi:hypothetical protein